MDSAGLESQLQSRLKAHGNNFLCAFSGGLDSSVLLQAAAKIPDIRLRAIHIHHGLHPDADRWAGHCLAFCDALGIELAVIKVEVMKQSGKGTEAAARHARYQAIAAHIRNDEILLTAHHLQDQAETLLLRLLRGSGSQGLAAMRDKTSAHGFEQFRPLLPVSKAVLQAYANSEKLNWIEDPSNTQTDFDRNFLRHDIMPLLEKRWPQAAVNFFRSAELLAEEHECLYRQSMIFLAQVQGVDERTLSVPALMQRERPWRAQILRSWTQSLDTPPLPGNILQEIEQSLLVARPDARACVQWSGVEIARWRDFLYLSDIRLAMPPDWQTRWDGTGTFEMPNGDRWAFVSGENVIDRGAAVREHFGANFLASLRRGGEKILLTNREHHSTIKNCLQESGIPPWERRKLPFLFDASGECLAVGDILLSARFEAFCKSYGVRFTLQV